MHGRRASLPLDLPVRRLRAWAVSLVLAPVALAAPQEGPPPTAVRAVRAAVRPTVQREAVTGSLRAAAEATLAAREEGPVQAVLVREGDVVRAGEVLARIDDRRLVARRAELVASKAEADATHVSRSAILADAVEDLAALEAAAAKGNSVFERELRVARTRVESARADADAASQRSAATAAQLELLEIRIADAQVVAPFDGTVVARHAEVGEWVTAGDPVVELVSTTALEVWLDVPERLLAGLRDAPPSLPVHVAGRVASYTAHRPRIVPRVSDRTRKFPVVLDLHAAESDALSPGMSVSAWLPVGEQRDTLMVPKDALVYRPGGISVMVVDGDDQGGEDLRGVASQVPVGILFETDREVALTTDSLDPRAVVVVEGNERLFPGTPVQAAISLWPAGEDSKGRSGESPR